MKQAVIIAGGYATRLYPVTKKIPKALVPVNSRPHIEYVFDLCRKNNIEEVVLCVGHLWEQIKDHVEDGKKFGVKVHYSVENDKLDTGGAIKNALPYLDDVFMTFYGDAYLDIDWQDIYRHYEKSKSRGAMSVYKNDWKLVPSTIMVKDEYIQEFNKENPRKEMQYMEYGINIFPKDIIDKVPGKAFPISEYFDYVIKNGGLAAYETKAMFYDMGTPEGLEKFKKNILGSKKK